MAILKTIWTAAAVTAGFYWITIYTQMPVSNDALFVGLCIMGAGFIAADDHSRKRGGK